MNSFGGGGAASCFVDGGEEVGDEAAYVVEGVVEGGRGDADDVRSADVDEDVAVAEAVEDGVHRREGGCLKEEGELGPALRGVRRGEHGEAFAEGVPEEELEVGGKFDGLGSELSHRGRGKEGQGLLQGEDRQGRWIRELEAGDAREGIEGRFHLEPRVAPVAPPPPQRLLRELQSPLLVDEGAGDGPGSGVEVLVGAPAGKVDVIVVEVQRDVADGVRAVEAHESPDVPGRFDDGLDVVEGSGVILERRDQHEGDL
mmetsp:Transcript_33684/g.107643  ORF Transcript_33684/g.107643 Transcript_33684/m.107643 type:complete len:257 (-) Transcript_33684:568-1338(-)